MVVFGGILSLANVAGTLVFLFLLIFLVMLEFGVALLEKTFIQYGYAEIFDKLKKELMILGIISFTVFIYESSASETLTQWFLAFEIAHIIILFMALSFIVQALVLVQYSSSAGRRLVVAVRTTSDELIKQYHNLKTSSSSNLYERLQKFCFLHLACWVPFYPEFRHHIEYKIIERFFLRQHKLPREFKFSKYANALFKNYISELGDIPSLGWFLIALAVVINYIRIAFIDGSAQSHYCSESHGSSAHRRYLSADQHDDNNIFSNPYYVIDLFNAFQSSFQTSSSYDIGYGTTLRALAGAEGGHSSSGETIDASIEKSCLQYIFVYSFVCVCMLTLVIFVTYVMSSIYLERLLEVCMNRDSISMKENGRKAYLECLELMHSSEKKILDKNRKNMLELSGSIKFDDDSIFYGDLSEDGENVNNIPSEYKSTDANQASSPRQHPLRPLSSGGRPPSISSYDNPFSNEPSPGRSRRNSVRHLSFSLDDYYHEREQDDLKKEHQDEIINQMPWYRQALFHMYRIWLRTRKFFSNVQHYFNPEDSFRGRRSSFDEDFESVNMKAFSMVNPNSSENKKRRHSSSKRNLSVAKRVFMFGSPKLYYRIVELGLLFQCFYISMWATQLMPLATYSSNKDYWIPLLTIPILINILFFGMTLHRSVMLLTATELNSEIVGTVCEECIQEKNVIRDLQTRLREKLNENNTPRRLWKVFIRDQFHDFDLDNDGSLDHLEFREFLGSLDIFMGKRHFDILWEAIDIDLSTSITWDELFIIVFPEFQSDIREELKIVDTIQQHMKNYFVINKIPKLKYIQCMQELYEKYDHRGYNSLTNSELWLLLKDVGLTGVSKKMFQLLVLSMDYTGTGEIQFTEFIRVIFGQGLAAIATADGRSTIIPRASRTSLSLQGYSDATNGQTRSRASMRTERVSVSHLSGPFSGIINPDAAVDSNADPMLPRFNPTVGGYKRVSTFEMAQLAGKSNKDKDKDSSKNRSRNSANKQKNDGNNLGKIEELSIDIEYHGPPGDEDEDHHSPSSQKLSPINKLFQSIPEPDQHHEHHDHPINHNMLHVRPSSQPHTPTSIDMSMDDHHGMSHSDPVSPVFSRRESIVMEDTADALAALKESIRVARDQSIDI